MKGPRNHATPLSGRARELRAELARRIAFSIGSAEKRVTRTASSTRTTGCTWNTNAGSIEQNL